MKAKLFAAVLSFTLLSNTCLAANVADIKPVKSISQTINQKINLNTASVTELTNSFKGIGVKRAQNIVNYRTEHGNFKDVTEIANVKGIGKNFVAKNSIELKNTFSTE